MKSMALGFLLPCLLLMMGELYLKFTYQGKYEQALASKALPILGPSFLLKEKGGAEFSKDRLLPLGGMAQQLSLLCEEEDGPLFATSDSFGFSNPPGSWKSQSTHWLFLGDSYFQGHCVPPGKSFIDLFREGGKNKVINLSSFGWGPLSQLGALREYGAKLRPKHVILSSVANDLATDLVRELNTAALSQYLCRKSQGLSLRQREIDELYKNFLKSVDKKLFDRPRGPFHTIDKWRSLYLSRTRGKPQKSTFITDYQQIDAINWDMYYAILSQMQDLVSSWGGKVHLLFIPDASFFSLPPKLRADFTSKLKEGASVNHISFLDLSTLEIFKKNPYPYYSAMESFYGHFNQAGHRVVYDYLAKYFL